MNASKVYLSVYMIFTICALKFQEDASVTVMSADLDNSTAREKPRHTKPLSGSNFSTSTLSINRNHEDVNFQEYMFLIVGISEVRITFFNF